MVSTKQDPAKFQAWAKKAINDFADEIDKMLLGDYKEKKTAKKILKAAGHEFPKAAKFRQRK